MSKKKLFLIIGGSVLGVILITCIVFGCWIKSVTSAFKSDVGICLSSTEETDVIWCKDEKEYSLWLSKILIVDRKLPQEISTKIIANEVISRVNLTKDDYQDVKENLYDIITYITDPIAEGIYIFLDKKENIYSAVYFKYDKKLQKELGNCMQAISLEDCWISSEVSLD